MCDCQWYSTWPYCLYWLVVLNELISDWCKESGCSVDWMLVLCIQLNWAEAERNPVLNAALFANSHDSKEALFSERQWMITVPCCCSVKGVNARQTMTDKRLAVLPFPQHCICGCIVDIQENAETYSSALFILRDFDSVFYMLPVGSQWDSTCHITDNETFLFFDFKST